jgi:hypothetical protein
MTQFEEIPGLAAPLRRALAEAGYPDLESLDGVDYAELAALHGVGRTGLARIQARLQESGRGLGGNVPGAPAAATSGESAAGWTRGHTGKTAKDVKTTITDVAPMDFVEGLEWPRRQEHGRFLLEVFERVTGVEPVMWGPTMVGYGEAHYVSPSGREGDWFVVGFSPRKANLALYGLQSAPDADELLPRLGKHKLGSGCVWINKPEDVDQDVLEQLIRGGWESVD